MKTTEHAINMTVNTEAFERGLSQAVASVDRFAATTPHALTERQQAVLDHIAAYIAEHGYSPSLRDVARSFGMTVNGALCHIRVLEKKGQLARDEGVYRSMRVIHN
jgi:repressor LexA